MKKDKTQSGRRIWTDAEKRFVERAIQSNMSLQDISNELDRTPVAVMQYMYRTRGPRLISTVKKNFVRELLLLRLPDPECFRPNRAFYQAVCISQKRWWTLYYGEAAATAAEYHALCKYFGISYQEALEARQLDLFPDLQPEQ